MLARTSRTPRIYCDGEEKGRGSPLSTNYTIAGNLIGTQADGVSDLGNDAQGIYLTYADAYMIQRNTIAHNGQDGIFLYDNAISHTISANSIFANGDLGIDLQFPGGVTANDAGDGNTGANNLQNFPVITLAESTVKGQAQINGTLNSLPNTTYTLEFFYNSAADASGHGEGEVYFGSETVTTDGSGNANFNATFNKTLPPNPNVTTTAIDPDGNTSEFSLVFLGQGLLDDPVTGLTATCTPASCEVTEGTPIQLDASISGGTGVSYAWKLRDGWADSGTTVTHTYATPGVYTATVMASNNNNSQSADVVVTVQPSGVSSSSSVYLPLIVKGN
jgi:parallel beta-helix repeat protein